MIYLSFLRQGKDENKRNHSVTDIESKKKQEVGSVGEIVVAGRRCRLGRPAATPQ